MMEIIETRPKILHQSPFCHAGRYTFAINFIPYYLHLSRKIYGLEIATP
jgi:hypothetical protein